MDEKNYVDLPEPLDQDIPQTYKHINMIAH